MWPRKDDPTRWTLGRAIELAAAADWLPTQQTNADSITSLAGEVGDVVTFLNDLRRMAVHPRRPCT